MKELDKGMVKYIYNSGSIKTLELVKKHIHKANDIKDLERIVSAVIRDTDKEMKEFEKLGDFDRP